jgi:hypothetical protein
MPILQFLKFTLSKTFKNKPFFLTFRKHINQNKPNQIKNNHYV